MREQVVIVNVTCDGCGTSLEEGPALTVAEIKIGRKKVLADLCGKCSAVIRRVVDGKKATTEKPARQRPNSAQRTEELKIIRAWANNHGYKVGEKGRIPQDVVSAYEAALGVAS